MYKSQHEYIEALEKAGELIRIKEFVDPILEITEVVDRISKMQSTNGKQEGGKAILFENTGTSYPLLINAMGSEKRMCMALGVNDLDDVGRDIESIFHTLSSPKNTLVDKLKMLPELGKISSWMPKLVSGRGECQEVVMADPDITKLPVLKCWPHDGGNFLTLPIIHTLDPHNGIRNVGLYRMHVYGPKLTALHWHKHKVSAGHFNEYKKLGKRMPVAVALGGDPLYVFSAACPLPPNMDEYMFTGFLRKKKVELVKCLTQDMYVPADADIIIEGYVDPNEDFILEGPFGDHTGYYSLADYYPKFHITAITHKKNAIYPATIVGIPPQEDAWIGKAIERIFLTPIKMTLLPEIVDIHMPVEGVFHNLVIVKFRNEYEGHAQKVMNAMWGAGQMMFNKILVVIDASTSLSTGSEINIHNYEEIARAISDNVDPANDIYFSQGPMDVLDHACTKFAFGGKMCLDATKKETPSQPSPKGKEMSAGSPPLGELEGVVGFNDSLLKIGISVLFISVKKNRKNHIKELNDKLFSLQGFENIKFVIYVEETVDVSDIKDTMWRFANNFDPKRDSYIFNYPTPRSPQRGESKSGGPGSATLSSLGRDGEGCSIGLDGTRKTKKLDNFDRPWPNIICADEVTIKSVDEKWDRLFSMSQIQYLTSPSLKYKKMLYKGGAIAEE